MTPTTAANNNHDIVDDWHHFAALVEDEHLINQAPYAIRVKQEDDAESARMRAAYRATRRVLARENMGGVSRPYSKERPLSLIRGVR